MLSQTDKTLGDRIEEPSSLFQNQQVSRIRIYLLLLLIIQWTLCIVTLGFGFYSMVVEDVADTASEIKSLAPVLTLFIYYTFGLLITYNYHRIGLLVFAWVGLVLLLSAFILGSYIILVIVALSNAFGSTGNAVKISLVIVVFAIVTIVAAISIKLTFNLAKLIKKNEYLGV